MFNRYVCLFLLLLGTVACVNSSEQISYNFTGTRPTSGWNADPALWVINNQALAISPLNHFYSIAHNPNHTTNPSWDTFISTLVKESKAGIGVLGNQAGKRASFAEIKVIKDCKSM